MMNENEAMIQFGPPNVPVAFFSLGQMPPGIQISFGLETFDELSILQLTERLTCWKYDRYKWFVDSNICLKLYKLFRL